MEQKRMFVWVIFLMLTFTLVSLAQTTKSEVRFAQSVNAETISEVLEKPIELFEDASGSLYGIFSDSEIRVLVESGIVLEVLQTQTDAGEVTNQGWNEKGTYSITRTNPTGFAINFANTQSITISDAPTNAKVSTVTVRVKGMAAYADLCDFALRSSYGAPNIVSYTFPKWYDEIWFDHTVSNITAFQGQPVNQTWTLYGKGSNTAGERVEQWWITIYYTYSEEGGGEGGGGGGDLSQYFDLNCTEENMPCGYQYLGITMPVLSQLEQGGQHYVEVKVPLRSVTDYYGMLTYAACITIDEVSRTVLLNYGVRQPPRLYPTVYIPVDTFIFTAGPLHAGTWRFRNNYLSGGAIDQRPIFDVYFTVTDSVTPPHPEPALFVTGPPRVEEGKPVTLSATMKNMTEPFTCQWYKNGLLIPDAIRPELHFPAIRPEDSGRYRVVICTEDTKILLSQEFTLRVYSSGALPINSTWSWLFTVVLIVVLGCVKLQSIRLKVGPQRYLRKK